MARILVYTSPAAGHLFPLVPGLLALGERGHDVHLRIGERPLGVARDAGLERRADRPRDRRDRGRRLPGQARRRQAAARDLHDLLARGPLERRISIARSPRSSPT